GGQYSGSGDEYLQWLSNLVGEHRGGIARSGPEQQSLSHFVFGRALPFLDDIPGQHRGRGDPPALSEKGVSVMSRAVIIPEEPKLEAAPPPAMKGPARKPRATSRTS